MTAADDGLVDRRRRAARWLAEQGFAIVRIKDGHKAPVGEGWQRRAVTDPGMAEGLIESDVDQFGALPRAGSGLLVVDEDVPGALDALGTPIPTTLRVRTSVKREDGTRDERSRAFLPERCGQPSDGDRGPFCWSQSRSSRRHVAHTAQPPMSCVGSDGSTWTPVSSIGVG